MVGNNLREEILTSCKATAMIYNDSQKKWLHCAANGPAKVQLLFSAENQTYRIVGRQIQDHEVVLNHSISKGIKYNQATSTFHQWRDQSCVYGLNFSSKLDAQEFGTTMLKILDNVNGNSSNLCSTLPPSSNTPIYKRQSSQPPISSSSYVVEDEETNYALISDSCQLYGENKPSNIPPAPPLNLPNPPTPPVAPIFPSNGGTTTRKSVAPQMDLMSEMAAKFAQRRKLLDENPNETTTTTINVKNSTTKIVSTSSPCVTRKTTTENNGVSTSIDFDKFKVELLTEIRKEIDKAKQEILNALLDQHTKI